MALSVGNMNIQMQKVYHKEPFSFLIACAPLKRFVVSGILLFVLVLYWYDAMIATGAFVHYIISADYEQYNYNTAFIISAWYCILGTWWC